MKRIKTLALFTLISFYALSQSKDENIDTKNNIIQSEEKNDTTNSLLKSFSIYADYNVIKAMHLNGTTEPPDEEDIYNLNSIVIKVKKEFKLFKKLKLNTGIGYSFGFEYIPVEIGISYEMFKNFKAEIGSGLYSLIDDRWVVQGTNNDNGYYFCLNYMMKNNIGAQLQYNLIEPHEALENSSMSLTSFSFGLSYHL